MRNRQRGMGDPRDFWQAQTGIADVSPLAQATAMRDLARACVEAQDANAIFNAAVNILGPASGFDRCAIFAEDIIASLSTPVAVWSRESASADIPPIVPFSLDRHPLFIEHIINSKEPILSCITHPHEIFVKEGSAQELHHEFGVKTVLGFPFSFRKNRFYSVNFGAWIKPLAPTQELVDFLRDAVSLISATLERLALIEETTLHSDLVKKLSEYSDQLVGPEFLSAIVSTLADVGGFDFVIIGELTSEDVCIVRTLAAVLDGRSLHSFEYRLPGTACERALADGYYVCTHEAWKLFPQATSKIDVLAESYVGVRLVDLNGKVIGVLAACSRSVMHTPELKLELLKVLAARIGTEIDRVRRTDALEFGRKRMEGILEHLTEPVLLIDSKANVLWCNQVAKGLAEIGDQIFEQYQAGIFEFCQSNREIEEIEIYLPFDVPAENRAEKHILQLVRLVANEFDDASVVMVLRNVTKEWLEKREVAELARLAESEREQLEEELTRFDVTVAHDVRSPLRAIDGFARLLEQDLGHLIDHDSQEHITRIRHASRRLSQMLDGLLTLGRIMRHSVSRGPVQVSNVATSFLDSVSPTAGLSKIKLSVDESLTIFGDPKLVSLALQNLIQNSVMAMEQVEAPLLKIYRTSSENGPCLCIEDNGRGFRSEHASRLFEPFEHIHGPDVKGGLGIGLAIVQRIAKRHGGGITAEGRQGKGSKFCIFWPGMFANTINESSHEWNSPANSLN